MKAASTYINGSLKAAGNFCRNLQKLSTPAAFGNPFKPVRAGLKKTLLGLDSVIANP
jgi:hypothetical protein